MSNRHGKSNDISDMGRAAEETEAQRAVNRQLIQEGRIIRIKELEKHRQEEENGYEESSRHNSTAATRYGNSRYSIENSSVSSTSTRSTDARDLRMQLIELEEKFKAAMVANVQLDNEKQLLRYEVDLLKDKLEDLRDSSSAYQRAFLEKKRDLAYNRMQITELTHRLDFARKQIEARDQLIVEHNLILLGGSDLDSVPPLPADQQANLRDSEREESPIKSTNRSKKKLENGVFGLNGDACNHDSSPTMALISKTTADLLKSLPETKLEAQILHLFSTRDELSARIEKLEAQLEEERKLPESSSRYDARLRLTNGPSDSEWKHELQNLRNQAQEYRYKLQEAVQKNSSLESDIVRLEGQIKRYKTIADTCEQQEAELKQERRQLLREVREVRTQLDDSKAENARLQRKLDKLSKSAGLSGVLSRGSRDSSVHG